MPTVLRILNGSAEQVCIAETTKRRVLNCVGRLASRRNGLAAAIKRVHAHGHGAGFFLKARSGLGGALPAWIFGATGHVSNAQQSAEAANDIGLGFIWLPAPWYGMAVIPVLFYRVFEALDVQIHKD